MSSDVSSCPLNCEGTLDIAEKDSMEIYIEGDTIILKKYQPACIFCDNARDIVTYRGKNVCSDCIRMLEEKI